MRLMLPVSYVIRPDCIVLEFRTNKAVLYPGCYLDVYGGGGQGGGGTGIEGAESGVEGAESGVEGAGSGSRGGGKRGNCGRGSGKIGGQNCFF